MSPRSWGWISLALATVSVAWIATAVVGGRQVVEAVEVEQRIGWPAGENDPPSCFVDTRAVAPLVLTVKEGCYKTHGFRGGAESLHVHLWFFGPHARVATLYVAES